MVAESFTLVRASGLTKVGDGGGIEGEDIIVHRVRRADVVSFIEQKRDEGVGIDVRLLLLLGSEYLR
jgi:ADP-ribose pyrophosphatase